MSPEIQLLRLDVREVSGGVRKGGTTGKLMQDFDSGFANFSLLKREMILDLNIIILLSEYRRQ